MVSEDRAQEIAIGELELAGAAREARPSLGARDAHPGRQVHFERVAERRRVEHLRHPKDPVVELEAAHHRVLDEVVAVGIHQEYDLALTPHREDVADQCQDSEEGAPRLVDHAAQIGAPPHGGVGVDVTPRAAVDEDRGRGAAIVGERLGARAIGARRLAPPQPLDAIPLFRHGARAAVDRGSGASWGNTNKSSQPAPTYPQRS